MLPLWFSQSIYFNINKKENYISISRIAFVYVKIFEEFRFFRCLSCSIVLVCFSTCCFNSPFMISIHSDLWSMLQPGKIFIFTRKKGGWTRSVFLTRTAAYDDRQIFVSLVQLGCLFLVHVFTYCAISFNACSVPLTNRSLFVRSMKKQWNIFTHDREKNRGLQKWNRRKKRAIIMCNFQTQNIIQP